MEIAAPAEGDEIQHNFSDSNNDVSDFTEQFDSSVILIVQVEPPTPILLMRLS
jgi:hypothetical protein